MSEENQGGLSASEAAYFESGGETEITVELPSIPEDTPAHPIPAAVDPENPPHDAADNADKNKFVPHGALHAEREERKKLQTQLAELQTKSAVLEDRWNTILKVQQPQEETKAPPDPNEDIFAYSKWQAEQLEALKAKVEGREQQEVQSRQQMEQEQAVWSEWSQSAQSFASQTPDFGDAVKFLSGAREKQLTAMARVDPRFADQNGRTQQINAELKGIILAAKQQGISPAEAVYQIAKDYGFTAPMPDPAQTSEKIEQIDAAQNASRTLAATSGKPAGDALTAQAIADMPAAEFDRWLSKPENQQRFNKLMGA